MISVQLDALDLLANPASAMSFTPRPWVFYRTVDKVVRIYRVIADTRNVRIRLSGTSICEALLDERTIHIIPSVFIDNAVKYSAPESVVEVHVCDAVRDKRPVIVVEVTSVGPIATQDEEQNLFIKRGRGMAAKAVAEGSGVGLALAKVVADQHKGWITAAQHPIDTNKAQWTFTFQIPRRPSRP